MQKIVVKEVELVHVVDLIIEDIHLIIIIDQDQDHYHHHIQEKEKQDIMIVEVEVEEEIEVIQEIVIDINYDIYFIFLYFKKILHYF